MAVRPFNSIAGFSTGDPAISIIQANGDVTTINLTANGIVNLGNVSNVHIDGGNVDQYLRTDGAGNLSWDSIGNLSSNRVAVMPYLIQTGESYILPNNLQGLYSQPITIDGTLEVDGMLIEIQDSIQSSPEQILFDNNGIPTGNYGFTFQSWSGNLSVPGNINVTGNIIPAANVTYDLGTSNNRFNDIWLSNSTIYIGDSEITTAANNLVLTSGTGASLTVTGDANVTTLTNGNSNIAIDLNGDIRFGVGGTPNVLVLTSNGIDYDGNLVVNGNIIANGGNLTGNVVTANTANIKNALINISLDLEDGVPINFIGNTSNSNIMLVDDDILINTGNTDLIFKGGAFALAASNGNTIGTFSCLDDDILINTGNTDLVFGGGAFVLTKAGSANANIMLVDDDILINTGNLGDLIFGGGAIVAAAMTANANVSAGNVKTDHLLYANGVAWNFGQDPGGSNTQIQFNNSGNFAGSANLVFNNATNNLSVTGNIVASTGAIYGNAAGLTNIPGANITGNISGNISNAEHANTSNTVTTAAQPNITSVGTLTSLDVSGSAVITGNLTVDGNLIYINVETLSVEDPIIQLQTGPNGSPPVSNSGKDVGSALNYYDTQARVAFMGWDTSNAEFAFGSQTTITNEVVTFNTLGNVRAQTFKGNVEVGAVRANGSVGTAGQVLTSNGTNTYWSTRFYYGDTPPDFATLNYGDIFFYVDNPNNYQRLYMWVTDGTSDYFYDFLPPSF